MDHPLNPHPDTPADPPSPRLVTQPLWDVPVRLLHGLMALGLAGAWLTAEAEGWRAVHISFGLTLALAVGLRVIWGFIGSGPARFTSFLRGPVAVRAHLRDLLAGRAGPHAGHNPAGGWAVLALLAGGLLAAGSGWWVYSAGEAWEKVHEALATGLLALVGLHVTAVLLTSWLSHDTLVPAMVTGRKAVPAGTAPTRRQHRGLAALMLVAVLGLWVWGLGPNSPWRAEATGEHGERHHGGHDRDDD